MASNAISAGRPKIALYAARQWNTTNSSNLETIHESSPNVTTNPIVLMAADPSPENPYRVIEVAFKSATDNPIFSRVDLKSRFTELLLSTSVLRTLRLVSLTVMCNTLLCGNWTWLASSSVKMIGSFSNHCYYNNRYFGMNSTPLWDFSSLMYLFWAPLLVPAK